MLNLVLFGPPVSGKGTQSAKLIEKYKLVHLSTGDILRGEITAQTPLGLEAKKKMDKGELVPDEVVIGMIGNKLDKNTDAKGFIFDGFPRTTAQATSRNWWTVFSIVAKIQDALTIRIYRLSKTA